MQVFQAEALRHPAAALGLPSGGSFVPNDIALGGQAPPFLVLTGPNMGGKSTLLRQVRLTYHSLHALARGIKGSRIDKIRKSPSNSCAVKYWNTICTASCA